MFRAYIMVLCQLMHKSVYLFRWIEYGKRFRACRFAQSTIAVDGARLTMEPFIQKHQPDRYRYR